MNIFHSRRKTMALSVTIAGIASLVLSTTVLASVVTKHAEKVIRTQNCAKGIPVNSQAESAVLDAEQGMVRVMVTDANGTTDLELPYEPATSFKGCADSTKQLLAIVKKTNDDIVRDTCADFRAIANGQKPALAKNGRTPNTDGAKNYLATYCK